MKTAPINMVGGMNSISANNKQPTAIDGFADLLSQQIKQTSQLGATSKEMTRLAAMGNANVSLHDAQIASARADVHLRLLMQVRNKALDVYKEVMSMQV